MIFSFGISSFWVLLTMLVCLFLGGVSLVAAFRARAHEELKKRLHRLRRTPGAENAPATLQRDEMVAALEKIAPKEADSKERGLAHKLEQAGLEPERVKLAFVFSRVLLAAAGGGGTWLFLSETMFAKSPWAIILISAAGFLSSFLPVLYLKSRLASREREIEQAVPDMIDLLILCTEAGLTLEVALSRAIEALGPYARALAQEMRITLNEFRILPDKSMALNNLEQRTGSVSLKYLVLALRQSERYGTSVGGALRAVAEENRKTAMLTLETRAARMPALLSVPLILLILPPVIALAAGPGFVLLLRSIGGGT
ncbi:MAG: type II secretion system F family protein [Alphaproteobacteria bacterium]|nr:MAG: type II secretion system F family protein [Alphaproteobacteria bacterium]